MDFKDWDFFAWNESERIPEAPSTSDHILSWWYVIPIMVVYLFFYLGGLG